MRDFAKRLILYTIRQLMNLPPTIWLIDKLIAAGTFFVIYGPSGVGKTFFALDLALCVATGTSWFGRRVKQGPVVYIGAEGGRGTQKRIRAWMLENGFDDVPDMFLALEPVQLRDPMEMKLLEDRIKGINIMPTLVIFDTFARCSVGSDENSAKDVGECIHALGLIEATVGLVHHTGKPKADRTPQAERGSSALRAGAETMISVQGAKGMISITVDKQKDEEPAAPIYVVLKRIELGLDPETGDPVTSCVLIEAPLHDDSIRPPLTQAEFVTLRTLGGFPEGTAESGAWRKAVPPLDGKSISTRTFHRHRDLFLQRGMVDEIDARLHRYRISPDGLAELPSASASTVPTPCHGTGPSAASATPPLGVAVAEGDIPIDEDFRDAS